MESEEEDRHYELEDGQPLSVQLRSHLITIMQQNLYQLQANGVTPTNVQENEGAMDANLDDDQHRANLMYSILLSLNHPQSNEVIPTSIEMSDGPPITLEGDSVRMVVIEGSEGQGALPSASDPGFEFPSELGAEEIVCNNRRHRQDSETGSVWLEPYSEDEQDDLHPEEPENVIDESSHEELRPPPESDLMNKSFSRTNPGAQDEPCTEKPRNQ